MAALHRVVQQIKIGAAFNAAPFLVRRGDINAAYLGEADICRPAQAASTT